MLAIKDMAGVAKPRAAKLLVMALKEELSLPAHFQTHDTSGASSASALTPQDGHLLTKCNGLSQQS